MVARVRGLHELPLERLLFVVVLGCSVLLLSVVMIRSEQHAPVAAPRTLFRDGFIVASDTRRTESNGTALAVRTEDTRKTQVQVEQQGEHTMTTIQTEDGDEITIKRAANSKKITTISAHENGKITIENKHDDEETTTTSPPPATKEEIDEEDDATRRVGYEKLSPGKKDLPVVVLGDAQELLALDEKSQPQRRQSEDKTAKRDDASNKKVTVVEVGRTLTKVSVQDKASRKDHETRR